MIIKEHTRNQKRMYRIHKMEEQIEKDKYIIGNQQQEIERLNNIINELEKWVEDAQPYDDYITLGKYDGVYYIDTDIILDKIKELKEK